MNPAVTFINVHWDLANGQRISAEVAHGSNLMQAAQFESVPGIDGDCGGCLSCATCHVVVDEAFAERVGKPGRDENMMLDCTAVQRQPHSRLSCQIEAGPALEGLVLRVPAA